MRNSSDIFCLKEPKIGENDGSMIFSVNGSSFSKINRRHHSSSDVFQFGQQNVPQATQSCDTLELPDVEVAKSEPVPVEDEKTEDKDLGEPAAGGSSMPRNPLTGDGVEDERKQTYKKRAGRKAGKWLW